MAIIAMEHHINDYAVHLVAAIAVENHLNDYAVAVVVQGFALYSQVVWTEVVEIHSDQNLGAKQSKPIYSITLFDIVITLCCEKQNQTECALYHVVVIIVIIKNPVKH